MTHSELCSIESTMGRAVGAAKTFADSTDSKQMNAGMYLLAEVRNAGKFLCDENTSPELRQQIIDTLVDAIVLGKM